MNWPWESNEHAQVSIPEIIWDIGAHTNFYNNHYQ